MFDRTYPWVNNLNGDWGRRGNRVITSVFFYSTVFLVIKKRFWQRRNLFKMFTEMHSIVKLIFKKYETICFANFFLWMKGRVEIGGNRTCVLWIATCPSCYPASARKKLCWLPTRRKYIYSATLENSYRNLSLSPLGQWDSSWWIFSEKKNHSRDKDKRNLAVRMRSERSKEKNLRHFSNMSFQFPVCSSFVNPPFPPLPSAPLRPFSLETRNRALVLVVS